MCKTNPLWQRVQHSTHPILYDIRRIHGMYGVHVLGRATPCVMSGTHDSVKFQDFRNCIEVSLLPYPPPFEEPLTRRTSFCYEVIISEVRTLFYLYTKGRFFIQGEPLRILDSTRRTFISHVP